ncbi:PAP/25A associated domain family [Fonsecaea pedrosoi]|nr:PAP/25A associated domain family [Fonsecaea pedrosoi]
MPSTPFQRSESRSHTRTSPSPEPPAKPSSPRSLPSDKSHTPPASRKQYGGCKYETSMQRARRRVPYSLGPDPLEKDKSDLKTRLTHEENETLTQDMQKLYEELQPTAESEGRRSRFIEKLDQILRGRWPTSSIKVNVFGSTGNNLGTSDSDVDICITTDCKEMERVCNIADLLAKHGMERVVCVSSAKVPIVKIWDPELHVACDINVNNPLALENTQLVRTYVSIDSRVRPLAMIIKYWAKRRMLNDAALGGTLSSYTWICLALNFLQTRDPPILPTLQQQPNLQPKEVAGVNVSFDRNVDAHKDFGSRNQSSLGELLFHFFRYYGHELDFEQSVVSVRLGRVLSKVEKSWHLLQDNRLCVEEPFNVSRNLANTADDTSMRGIHLELRRAFELLGEGKLTECCEQFVHPPDEIKPSEHFVPPSARPVIPQPPNPPSRGARNASRGGGRNLGQMGRNPRRSSNPTARNPNYLRNPPFQMNTHELQLQQQHQQHLLHDQLFQQYQYLQLQEQELRMQLYQQNLRQRGLMAAYSQSAGYGQFVPDDGLDLGSNPQVNGIGRAPMSAPLYQHGFPRSPYLSASQPSQGVATNPPSPRLNSGIPDTRRYSRRTSVTQSSTGGSLRAQSQPARAVPLTSLGHLQRPDIASLQDPSIGRRSSSSSTSQEPYMGYMENGYGMTGSIYDAVRRPAEYLGYYVGQSPSLSAYTQSTAISPIPSHVGLAIQNGGLSPRLAPASTRPSGTMHTPPLQTISTASVEVQAEAEQEPRNGEASNIEPTPSKPRAGPLIVDGSINSPLRRRTTHSFNDPEDHINFSASTSEDLAFDTPSSSDEQSQDAFDCNAHGKTSPISPSGPRNHVQHSTNAAPDFVNGYLPLRAMAKSPKEGLQDQVAGVGESVGMSVLTTMKAVGPAWSLDRQLSSVEEVRTPSPRVEKFDGESSLPKDIKGHPSQNGPSSDGQTILVNGEHRDATRPLASRTNGTSGSSNHGSSHVNSVPNAGGPSGWQTQKKKKNKRKTVKSENDAQTSNPSVGETLPADESLRKGG